MGTNKINIYQNNSATIYCTVSGSSDISGYDSYMTVKKNITDETIIIGVTGSVDTLSVTMSLSPTDTDIDSGAYIYDIVIESGSSQYTIVKDNFIVSDAVLY